jgi:hypothetical protein
MLGVRGTVAAPKEAKASSSPWHPLHIQRHHSPGKLGFRLAMASISSGAWRCGARVLVWVHMRSSRVAENEEERRDDGGQRRVGAGLQHE